MNAFLAVLWIPVAAAAVDRSAPPALPDAQPFALQEPVSFTLKNGARVLFLERHRAPLIDVVANIDAGMAADPADKPGVAAWTSAMLLEGAGARDALAFADAQADLGAQIGAGAGGDASTVVLHVGAARFEPALALFADALTRPQVTAPDWQRVQQSLLGAMVMDSQDPLALAGLAAARAAWGREHRFALDGAGTPRTLRSATRDDVLAFHRAHYRPDTTTLIVVGAIKRPELERALNAALAHWTAVGAPPVPARMAPPQPRASRRLLAVQVNDAPQMVLRVVAAVPSRTRWLDANNEVMNTLFGGSFTSRLNDNLREQHGYAYGASSRFAFTRAGTVFSVRTSVQGDATVPAIAEIFAELERIHTPATVDEVTRARNLAALSFPAQFDGGRATASTWSELVSHGVDAAAVRLFLEEAHRVNVAGVQAAAQQDLPGGGETVVLVGDLRPHAAELKRFGLLDMVTAEDLMPGVADAAHGQ